MIKIFCRWMLLVSLFGIVTQQVLLAQHEDYQRLRAYNNNDTVFYNIDGISFVMQQSNLEYNEKNLKKLYKRYGVRNKDIKNKNKYITQENISIVKNFKISNKIHVPKCFYFVKNETSTISIFVFDHYGGIQRSFDSLYIDRILNNNIPQQVYVSSDMKKVEFAGRNLELGQSCRRLGVNDINCPSYGQISWSIHKDFESASKESQLRYLIMQDAEFGKIVSEKNIDVIFEGKTTKAKRVIYDFDVPGSAIARENPTLKLTLYFVVGEARGNYISCIMSHLNNDVIDADGLPKLLGKVMQLK